jgi:hypothetical protein
MSTVIFYRQTREDSGVRTGIEINNLTAFESFESNGDDHDPALRWYVDIRCEGNELPNTAGLVREWLLKNAMYIRDGLAVLADKVRAGVDLGFPLKWTVPNVPNGVSVVVTCSALRRIDAREIANILNGIGQHWEQLVGSLPAVATAAN